MPLLLNNGAHMALAMRRMARGELANMVGRHDCGIQER